ncbi:MAG: threonylcarbamoyl-AMP synthase [Prevotellaceae bacterium]|jgi:L-threonylcarbamoyladenylate synthase|nr:threonylcarbamoyl-AMP synthase [Prevotellaceae bacterium]
MRHALKNALDTLSNGGVIIYPTDTVWGIGCDATNENAVERIYTIKKRTHAKSMLILTDDVEKLSDYIENVPEMALKLIRLSDRPLTIIYPHAKNLAPNLIADDGSVGIRITTERFSKNLCKQFGKPIVSTSANIADKRSPANFNEITEEIKKEVDYVVTCRRYETVGRSPSTIIRIDNENRLEIIRK